eukprot:4278650-Prymnesium_polylepis.1
MSTATRRVEEGATRLRSRSAASICRGRQKIACDGLWGGCVRKCQGCVQGDGVRARAMREPFLMCGTAVGTCSNASRGRFAVVSATLRLMCTCALSSLFAGAIESACMRRPHASSQS